MNQQQLEKFKFFAKEVFQIVEWAIVVAAVQVLGKKLDLPLAELAGWVLFGILALYVGMRTEELVAWARKGRRPKIWPGIILPLLAALTFGNALSALVIALGKMSLGS